MYFWVGTRQFQTRSKSTLKVSGSQSICPEDQVLQKGQSKIVMGIKHPISSSAFITFSLLSIAKTIFIIASFLSSTVKKAKLSLASSKNLKIARSLRAKRTNKIALELEKKLL